MVRIKERYLLVNILYPTGLGDRRDIPDVVVLNQPTADHFTSQALLKAIRTHVTSLFGDYGSGHVEGSSLSVKYLSQATSTFILRTSRSSYRFVWTALSFMDCIPGKNGKPCVFRIVRVSGTMTKVEEEAIRRARGLIFEAQKGVEQHISSDPLSNIFGNSDRPHRGIGRIDPLKVEDDESDIETGEPIDG